MRYLHTTTSTKGLVYWRPTVRERSDLPRCDFIPLIPECSIDGRFPADLAPMEPVCFADASYDGLLPIEEHRSIMGIAFCLGGTVRLCSPRRRLKSYPTVMQEKISSTGESLSMTSNSISFNPHTWEGKMLVPSSLGTTIVPVDALFILTCNILPLENGSNEDS
jgi:hypothetical protein